MNCLYNFGIRLFAAGIAVASLRSAKLREMRAGGKSTLHDLKSVRKLCAPSGYDVWIHAASLGEFEQGRPLIERIRDKHPDYKILLTFFSPSGYRVRHNYDKVDTVAYLPIDTLHNVKTFLDAAQPRLAIFIKYEFWGNYLEQLHKRNIPTYIISAIFREGQRFFIHGGEMFRKMLTHFTRLYVQDEDSSRLLHKAGIEAVTVAGDTRFDRVTDIRRFAKPLPEVIEKYIAESPFTLVVGSSWAHDEDLIIPWAKSHPEVRLIVAPHEFDCERLAGMLNHFNSKTMLLSQIDEKKGVPAGCNCIIIDCFGLLANLYRCATAAYIGGGFGAGIHNINEAAVYGIPVIFGPNHYKFKEAADLIDLGGGFEVTDQASFNSTLNRLVEDSEFRSNAGRIAGDYINRNLGATDIIYNDIFKQQ